MDTNKFPLIIDAGYIRHFVTHYKRYFESDVAIISRICCGCRLFISLLLLVVVLRSDPVIVAALDKHAMNMAFLNHGR